MIFHQFHLGDVEDPDIYAAQPIWEWQQTDKGKWVMEHGIELAYIVNPDPTTLGYKICITGVLNSEDEVYYTLKYR